MASKWDRKYWFAAGLIVLVLLLTLAWIDGGERQIQPVVEEIPVPESAR